MVAVSAHLVRRRGRLPVVHEEAYVSPYAIVAGEVTIGGGTAVLDGAVVVAESAPVSIGRECVIMENAVLRGAGRHPLRLGDRVLVGPHAHLSGAEVGDECMVATGAAVFNGAVVGSGSLIAVGAIVHVGTRLPDNSRVPMQHIAVGDPATIFPPEQAPEAHRKVTEIGFTDMVFGHSTRDLDFRQSIAWVCRTYSAALRRSQKADELKGEG